MGWGGPPSGYSFWGGVSSFFLGHSHRMLNMSLESSAQAQLIATLFEQIE